MGPVRCKRCKAYMCSLMTFIDGGRRFQCNFCHCTTDVTTEYFAHMDHTGKRVDYYERPELCLGSFEYLATSDYCRDNKLPIEPAFIFMIDVSYNSVKTGLVKLLCNNLKNQVISCLPIDDGCIESEVRVGFVTYGREIHFYNINANLTRPQMLIIPDHEDSFVPLVDGFLVKPKDCESVIDSLLEQIPEMFEDCRDTETLLGPAVQACMHALRDSLRCGKIFVFSTSLPTRPGPGQLKNRDERKLLGTDKEKAVLGAAGSYYTDLAKECVACGCGVDLFLFPNSFMDVATVAELPRMTGGSIFKYSYFQADIDGDKFISDLANQVHNSVAFDGIMRVRTSTGIRPTDFYGNIFMSNTTDIEIACMDRQKSICVDIKHDDKLDEGDSVLIQATMLYTSVSGKRRLRVLNLSLKATTAMNELFRACDLDTLINLISKQAIRQTLNSTPVQTRNYMSNECAQTLACYRKYCASPSSIGQLVLPECMKLMPVYLNCLIKSHLLQGGKDIAIDDRSYVINLLNSMSIKDTNAFIYPRLIPIHNLDTSTPPADNKDFILPVAIRSSYERLQDSGAYIVDNGLQLLMWISQGISSEWLGDVFAVPTLANIEPDSQTLPVIESGMSKAIHAIITKIQSERIRTLKLKIIRQNDKQQEAIFKEMLVEDNSAQGLPSYVEYVCHIHKEIRNILS